MSRNFDANASGRGRRLVHACCQPEPGRAEIVVSARRWGSAMRNDFSELSGEWESRSASIPYLQASVERLVGPLVERRSGKDRRRVPRPSRGRRESDWHSEDEERGISQ